jgi:hypothetical protein
MRIFLIIRRKIVFCKPTAQWGGISAPPMLSTYFFLNVKYKFTHQVTRLEVHDMSDIRSTGKRRLKGGLVDIISNH